MLTRKFGKFLKKKGRDKVHSTKMYNFRKPVESSSSNFTYFDCGKQGHIKTI